MLLDFTGEWAIVDNHNEKWSGAVGVIQGNGRIVIVERIHYKLLLCEVANRNIKNKSSWLAKMKKKYKWK